MEYKKATLQESESIYKLVQDTIKIVYPKYYPKEVVDFFCEHHSLENILRDIEITVKSSIRNGIPVLIAQSKNNEIPDIKTGVDYRINEDDETLLNENFTYSDGDYKDYYEYHKDKWFSFVMGKDDPRFENAEPNRGLSSTKSHEGFHFDD